MFLLFNMVVVADDVVWARLLVLRGVSMFNGGGFRVVFGGESPLGLRSPSLCVAGGLFDGGLLGCGGVVGDRVCVPEGGVVRVSEVVALDAKNAGVLGGVLDELVGAPERLSAPAGGVVDVRCFVVRDKCLADRVVRVVGLCEGVEPLLLVKPRGVSGQRGLVGELLLSTGLHGGVVRAFVRELFGVAGGDMGLMLPVIVDVVGCEDTRVVLSGCGGGEFVRGFVLGRVPVWVEPRKIGGVTSVFGEGSFEGFSRLLVGFVDDCGLYLVVKVLREAVAVAYRGALVSGCGVVKPVFGGGWGKKNPVFSVGVLERLDGVLASEFLRLEGGVAGLGVEAERRAVSLLCVRLWGVFGGE